MKELLINTLQFLGLAFWVEIITDDPQCTYYFGPFSSKQEAESAQGGYIEDLENEGAQGISVTIMRGKPIHLTIFDETLEESTVSVRVPTLSGQLS
ncbi:MAG: DUF1816 domain-containing protein [Coleofasciculus sp. G1-WW12-02]|uniref:DUF1816 domain-containing protein n=1 Tax=unclassified Coleofasciculus TaxID=2692782 RepID=UPI0033020A47